MRFIRTVIYLSFSWKHCRSMHYFMQKMLYHSVSYFVCRFFTDWRAVFILDKTWFIRRCFYQGQLFVIAIHHSFLVWGMLKHTCIFDMLNVCLSALQAMYSCWEIVTLKLFFKTVMTVYQKKKVPKFDFKIISRLLDTFRSSFERLQVEVVLYKSLLKYYGSSLNTIWILFCTLKIISKPKHSKFKCYCTNLSGTNLFPFL